MTRRTKIGLVALGVTFALFVASRVLFRFSLVVGHSMVPTLQPWDYCVSVRVRNYEPRRGDIISFRTADDPPLYFIKRIIGLPGETVSIERGVVHINGKPLDEPYTTRNDRWELPPIVVPEARVFVLADNRIDEQQNYIQGIVATRLIKSRLLWRGRWKR